jgi:hypothetical protein
MAMWIWTGAIYCRLYKKFDFMKNIFNKLIKFILLNIIGKRKISAIANMYEVSSSIRILENDLGHYLSIEKQVPVDKDGNPLPWYTYPAIEYIRQFDLSGKSIFEWGSGNSSLFFAKRAKFVISVEDDKTWYENSFNFKLDNQEICFAKDAEYINCISRFGKKFDIIIIDGKYRSECAKVAPNFLNEGGFIILDNSDWYKNTAKHLREQNYIQIDFHGFGPVNQYNWTTSFFMNRNFNFITKNNLQPTNPVGCLEKICD